jgi:formylmethanofuran--tetrahydromethanopterin N-formyltransferase
VIINGTQIDDTFAEAFGMKATRLVITAATRTWAHNAASSMTGFATSVIGFGVEAGIERDLALDETPDGRPGVSVLFFAISGKDLARQMPINAGHSVMTSPTSALFAGNDGEEKINLGKSLRYFGDGFQISKVVGDKRYWRIPVMDGEFLCEEFAYITSAIGGGNIIILGQSRPQTLAAADRAVEAMRDLPGVVTPFPGGIVRSGSKVGSKYKGLIASTNDAFCPTLKGETRSELEPEIEAVMEIVIDGLTETAIAQAMRAGITAACKMGGPAGIRRITAGHYGGKLGQHQFRLREIMS